MEYKRPARLCGQGLSGRLQRSGRGFLLLTGDEAPSGTDRPSFGWLQSILELRREKGLFRHGHLRKASPRLRALRSWTAGAGHRGAAHYAGISRLFPRHLLHPQRPAGACPHRPPVKMGRSLSGIPQRAGQGKARYRLRRPERRPSGDRSEKSRLQPGQRGLLRRGTGKLRAASGRRVHRLLPPSPPGRHRRVHMVELHVQCPGEQRRLAH